MRAASKPPEERGLPRDGVRLLTATPDGLGHATFRDLPRFLAAGDLVVVNTSATVAAAVDGSRGDGRLVTAHFSTPLDDGTWLVELRGNTAAHERVTDAVPGETLTLPDGATLTLLSRYPAAGSSGGSLPRASTASDRIWTACVQANEDLSAFLARYGRPIRYSYVPDPWPLSAYQSVFARDPGSAEMPSAGRPFTGDLVATLIASGVVFAPITLHTGVASLETGEPPLPERYTVSEPTARLINLAREMDRRIIALGTTCTRAVESATDQDGVVHASGGWTDLVLGPERPARVVNGLVTGWHDPEASHLDLLQAVAGTDLVSAAYAEAERAGYLGHEFGDSCLLLPLD